MKSESKKEKHTEITYLQNNDLSDKDSSLYECIKHVATNAYIYGNQCSGRDWTDIEDTLKYGLRNCGYQLVIFETRDSQSVDIVNESDQEIVVQLKYNRLSKDNRFLCARRGEISWVPFYDPELHDTLVLEEQAHKYFVFNTL